jgi:hypothetical protein
MTTANTITASGNDDDHAADSIPPILAAHVSPADEHGASPTDGLDDSWPIDTSTDGRSSLFPIDMILHMPTNAAPRTLTDTLPLPLNT